MSEPRARFVGIALAVTMLVVTVGAAGWAVAAQSGAVDDGDNGTVIRLAVHHSRFIPDHVTVRAGTSVRFVIDNTDPILHEFIIGDAGIHERHENGTEQRHPPRPGEVTIDPGTTAETTFHFGDQGPVLYACHLPGHFAYGMFGNVQVTS
jgi:uncharacterized cupredoxin-like copper-binding protein